MEALLLNVCDKIQNEREPEEWRSKATWKCLLDKFGKHHPEYTRLNRNTAHEMHRKFSPFMFDDTKFLLYIHGKHDVDMGRISPRYTTERVLDMNALQTAIKQRLENWRYIFVKLSTIIEWTPTDFSEYVVDFPVKVNEKKYTIKIRKIEDNACVDTRTLVYNHTSNVQYGAYGQGDLRMKNK